MPSPVTPPGDSLFGVMSPARRRTVKSVLASLRAAIGHTGQALAAFHEVVAELDTHASQASHEYDAAQKRASQE